MTIDKLLLGVKKNILLKDYTTFGIGGRARYFFIAKTKSDLISAVIAAKRTKLSFFILGGGSNLLVADEGYKGLVIKIQNSKFKILNSKIYTEAGTPLSLIVNESVNKSLTGLEWAAGIPGTVGGAVFGNTGAFGKSMKNIIKEVEVFDIKNLKIKILKNKDCRFDYRDSIFKYKKNFIIVSTILQLKKTDKKEIKTKIKEFLDYKKRAQPLNFPSAGSIFKNPRNFFAGELIEKCSLKGKIIGGAKFSEKHANFIINFKNAKAKDVKNLINLAKNKVKNKFGVKLEEEIKIF